MSRFYTVLVGDTFSNVSRKIYGTEENEGFLIQVNPGATEPLTPGTQLITPVDPNAPTDLIQTADATDEDTVSILIDGKLFSSWHRMRMTRRLDGMSTAELTAPFEPDSAEAREVFRPFTYKTIVIYIGDEPQFTGTIVAVDPITELKQRTVTLMAYSLPGVLEDCTASVSSYPIEFNNQDLRAIATTLARPFGIGVVFLSQPGAVFEQVQLGAGRKVLDFLADLGRQRGLIANDSSAGELRFWNSTDTIQTEAQFVEGASPLVSITPQFNGQNYFSHITGIEPVRLGPTSGGKFTVKNSRLLAPFRPHVFEVTDAQDGELKTAVEAKAARMFGNMVAYSAQLSTWRDPEGFLFLPNSKVGVDAPGAMIYGAFDFITRAVTFEATAKTRTASLELVLPGSFDSKIPERLPWDE